MFLKKLFGAFFSSEPEYMRHSTNYKRKPTMEQQVKHVYPPTNKGEFKFPLIPEEDRKKVELSKVRDEVSKNKVNPFKDRQTPREIAEEEKSRKRNEDYKAPFKARNIPSPTHGFLNKKRPLRKVEKVELHVVSEKIEVNIETQGKKEVNVINEVVQETIKPPQTEIETPNEVMSETGGEQQPEPKTEHPYHYKISNEIEEDLLDNLEVQTSENPIVVDDDIEEEVVEEVPKHINEFITNFDKHPVLAQVKRPEQSSEVINEVPRTVITEAVKPVRQGNYLFPSLNMLKEPIIQTAADDTWIEEQRDLLEKALSDFQVRAEVVDMQQGPSITRFEVQPAPGVKVNKITNLSDDLKLSLAAKDIRIQAPIPGMNSVGIEIPNRESRPVLLREVLQSPEFLSSKSPLTVALGMDISGTPVVTDLKKMPHGLIAGATGSGKSVCINTFLISLLYKASPEEVKLLLVDPKMVELTPYNNLPHLVSPVITDSKAATKALKWAVQEMEDRYQKFVGMKVRDIERYNEKSEERMPYIVIIIDELADLMMVAPGDVEDAICRIAQKARACGIHLLLATQRPSVDVITGLIKANIPTRIAFAVSSQIDSRTILDEGGAEKLLGKGDMLFSGNGAKSVRLQGNFVSDDEIEEVTEFVKQQQEPRFLFEEGDLISQDNSMDAEDELFFEACEFVIEQGTASSSGLQRKFRVGYNRAARLIDLMEAKGIVSAQNGSKPREILVSMDRFIEMI